MSTVFTVGHSNRSLDEFVETLRSAGIQRIVDVRRYPGSRRNPHFAREAMAKSLPDRGIDYEWWGEELGGRRDPASVDSRHPAWRNDSFQAYADHMDTSEFRDALARLEKDAERIPLAVMCAETLWWKCHRRLISDALTIRNHDVVHVMGPGKSQPHKLHPNVRAEDGWPVYDVNIDRPLL